VSGYEYMSNIKEENIKNNNSSNQKGNKFIYIINIIIKVMKILNTTKNTCVYI